MEQLQRKHICPRVPALADEQAMARAHSARSVVFHGPAVQAISVRAQASRGEAAGSPILVSVYRGVPVPVQ